MLFDTLSVVDIRRDPRFTLEEQWYNEVAPNLTEGVTALTVFGSDGSIEGWVLHGWTPKNSFTKRGFVV
jgi:hypothetical protein